MDPLTKALLESWALPLSLVVNAATIAGLVAEHRRGTRIQHRAEEAHRWAKEHAERETKSANEEDEYRAWTRSIVEELTIRPFVSVAIEKLRWGKRAEREGLFTMKELPGGWEARPLPRK